MGSCENCGLRLRDQKDGRALCDPCVTLGRGDPQVHVSPISREDLELILAWRSHPDIYRHFRSQTEPLTWSEHLSWFESDDSIRDQFLLHYGGRRVGVIGLDTSDEITIYIGEFSAQGEGVATASIHWLTDRFADRTPLVAEVHPENEASRTLFKTCGFLETDRSDEWIRFEYRP